MDMKTRTYKDIETKEILIKDLPDCYEKTQLEQLCIDPATSHVHVVAKQGGLGSDWAAYIGWPDDKHLAEPEDEFILWHAKNRHSTYDVISYGDKLSANVAAQIFPEWAASFTYRS